MQENRPPFVVQVQAGFDENGSWVVRGELTYNEELSAQARELIDLSVMSQKQIIDDLQQLASNRRAVANEAA